MNTEKRIALACFIGGALGALIALELNRYLWWLGILLGGLAGYVGYEFKYVIRAFGKAWNATCKDYDDGFSKVRKVGKEWLMGLTKVGLTFLTSIAFLLTGFFWTVALYLLADWIVGSDFFLQEWYVITLAMLISSAMAGVVVLICQWRPGVGTRPSVPAWEYLALRVFKDTNPLSVACWWIPMGMIRLMKQAPLLAKLIWKMAKGTFVLVHSEIRLLCMTDAMIGALVGYWCGNAVIGGVVGAACGVLDYKLISVRWLKLAQR